MQTKKDYEQLLHKILNPVKPFYSEGKAYLDLGDFDAVYSKKIAGIEGFSRPLWGLAPYFADGKKNDEEFAKIYREGLKNGTNPFHPEYWGELTDCSQVMVEMAAMGLALLIAPETFFYPLSEKEQKNLASWLYTINDHTCWSNNWVMFQVIVNIGLKNVNMPYNDEKIEWSFAEVEKWYIGNGWYSDGASGRCDYYVAFAIHFYSLIYAKYIEKAYPDRSNRIKERARTFAKDFIFWFDKNGAAVPYGRSIIYRFAHVAFWSALVWADASPFPLGVVKGIINRNFEYWMDAPIFDKAGLLTVGYRYPNLMISEGYNAPGSPYWALKSFLILALPEDHEFFRVEEEPLPELEAVHAIPESKMIVTNSGDDAVLYVGGQAGNTDMGMFAEKYAKFAYSSKYAYSIARSNYCLDVMAPDSALTFKVNGRFFHKCESVESEILDDKRIRLKWLPCDGIEVETIVTPYGNSHKREHTIKAAFSCEAYDAGFAVPYDDETLEEKCGENEACIIGKKGGCRVYSEYGEGMILSPFPNTNLVSTHTKIPMVVYKIPIGESKITSIVYDIQENESV